MPVPRLPGQPGNAAARFVLYTATGSVLALLIVCSPLLKLRKPKALAEDDPES